MTADISFNINDATRSSWREKRKRVSATIKIKTFRRQSVIKKQQTTKCFKLCKKQHWYRWREVCPSIAYILTITSRYFKRELAIFGKGMASSKQRNTSNSKWSSCGHPQIQPHTHKHTHTHLRKKTNKNLLSGPDDTICTVCTTSEDQP